MKKKLTMILVAGMALSFAIGCSVFGAETAEPDRKFEMRMEKKEANMAKVVAVNEDTLVVKLAEKPERPEGEEGERLERPERPEGEKGDRPEKPEKPEGEEGERPEKPERPEGEEGERPEKLKHHGKMMQEMNFKEETEIALENVQIQLDSETEGSIEDIQADDMIMIRYAEDGETIESIFLRKGRKELKEAE